VNTTPIREIASGPFTGAVRAPYDTPESIAQLLDALKGDAATETPVVSQGPDRVTQHLIRIDEGAAPVAVKHFETRSWLQRRADDWFGTPAARSWRVALALVERGVGTPPPVAYAVETADRATQRSFYVSEYDAGLTSFRQALIHVYRDEPDCETCMALLESTANGVRRLHDAGVRHGDLGNQNILLRRIEPRAWTDVQFVDLNRARIRVGPLPLRERAYDLSRIYLPSDLLRIFKEMYFQGRPSEAFQRWEALYRLRFQWHTRTRALRRPLRTRKRRQALDPALQYPAERDLWLWDRRSGQPVNVWRRKDRKKRVPLRNSLEIAGAAWAGVPGVWSRYRACRAQCFSRPVSMARRIGVAVDGDAADFDRQLAILDELGAVPVLLRFYRHEGESGWAARADQARRLHARGHPVSVALVQDRESVREVSEWRHFVARVLESVHAYAEGVEIGHAINRVKWGLWTIREYAAMLLAISGELARYPEVEWYGPAAIDFEYPYVLAALRAVPPSLRFNALSHLLYVDRRGAPENSQCGFSALEKFALAKAVAQWSGACDDRLIVSEVNWPLRDTGVYSPVGAPYLFPGLRIEEPSVDEDHYANYMIRYLLLALCSGMVERVFWWRLVAHGFGLVDDADAAHWRPRPAFATLRFLLARLGESTFVEKMGSPVGTHLLRFEGGDGSDVYVGYSFAGETTIPRPNKTVALLDRSGGDIDDTGDTVRLTSSPVYLVT